MTWKCFLITGPLWGDCADDILMLYTCSCWNKWSSCWRLGTPWELRCVIVVCNIATVTLDQDHVHQLMNWVPWNFIYMYPIWKLATMTWQRWEGTRLVIPENVITQLDSLKSVSVIVSIAVMVQKHHLQPPRCLRNQTYYIQNSLDSYLHTNMQRVFMLKNTIENTRWGFTRFYETRKV